MDNLNYERKIEIIEITILCGFKKRIILLEAKQYATEWKLNFFGSVLKFHVEKVFLRKYWKTHFKC